jgi:hypothetical protein
MKLLSTEAAKLNICVYSSENPHQIIDHEQDCPEINVFYAISE